VLANGKMNSRLKLTVCGTALLIAAAVVVALRDRRREVSLPDVPVAQTPAEVRVKAVERNVETLDFSNVEAVKFLSREPRRTSTEVGIVERAFH
jgi:hypothetical protein